MLRLVWRSLKADVGVVLSSNQVWVAVGARVLCWLRVVTLFMMHFKGPAMNAGSGEHDFAVIGVERDCMPPCSLACSLQCRAGAVPPAVVNCRGKRVGVPLDFLCVGYCCCAWLGAPWTLVLLLMR